jgi:hypothetical protein
MNNAQQCLKGTSGRGDVKQTYETCADIQQQKREHPCNKVAQHDGNNSKDIRNDVANIDS